MTIVILSACFATLGLVFGEHILQKVIHILLRLLCVMFVQVFCFLPLWYLPFPRFAWELKLQFSADIPLSGHSWRMQFSACAMAMLACYRISLRFLLGDRFPKNSHFFFFFKIQPNSEWIHLFLYLANSHKSQQTNQDDFFLLTDNIAYIFLEHLIQDEQFVN